MKEISWIYVPHHCIEVERYDLEMCYCTIELLCMWEYANFALDFIHYHWAKTEDTTSVSARFLQENKISVHNWYTNTNIKQQKWYNIWFGLAVIGWWWCFDNIQCIHARVFVYAKMFMPNTCVIWVMSHSAKPQTVIHVRESTTHPQCLTKCPNENKRIPMQFVDQCASSWDRLWTERMSENKMFCSNTHNAQSFMGCLNVYMPMKYKHQQTPSINEWNDEDEISHEKETKTNAMWFLLLWHTRVTVNNNVT